MITGYRCAVCQTTVPIDTPQPWRCPNGVADPHHVLHLVEDPMVGDELDDANPFVRFAPRMAWWAFADMHGMRESERLAIVAEVADDFTITPFDRSPQLSEAVGVDIWVKDETGNVAGSHKARHLAGILLQLLAAERARPARRTPTAGDCVVRQRRHRRRHACQPSRVAARRVRADLDERRRWRSAASASTPRSIAVSVARPTRPAIRRCCASARRSPPARFRSRCRARRTHWRSMLGARSGGRSGRRLRRCNRGATGESPFRSAVGRWPPCVGVGLGRDVRLDTVQADGCAPLAETWERIVDIDHPERYWAQVMRPWPNPMSVADGILDDETYDWIADVSVMVESGGAPIVASEPDIRAAHEIARQAGFDVSATGSAGLAGVLSVRHTLHVNDQVIVIMSGVAR